MRDVLDIVAIGICGIIAFVGIAVIMINYGIY